MLTNSTNDFPCQPKHAELRSDACVGGVDSAPRALFGRPKRIAAVAFTMFGVALAAGQGPSLELSRLNGTNGVRLEGAAPGDESGYSVATAGDINGDNIDDVIIGSPSASSGASPAGASDVVFGKAGPRESPIVLGSLDGSTGFRLNGVAANDRSGHSVSGAGDINADGRDDIIIGAPYADPYGELSGSSYVIYGKINGYSSQLDLLTLDGVSGFRLDGVNSDDQSGYSVSSAGDFNGDGIDDVVIGSLGSDHAGSASGSSFVVYGRSVGFAPAESLSALTPTTGVRIDGAAGGDFSGSAVADAGDVNGDGVDDIIIGAYLADVGGKVNCGSSFVVFGHRGGFDAPISLATLDGTTGFRINGESSGDLSGGSVAGAGDVNADGISDVVVGAAHRANQAGASYVVFGRSVAFPATISLDTMDPTTGFRVDGPATDSFAGSSVASAGDVDGDGVDDILVGAEGTPSGSFVGTTYVVFGHSSPSPAVIKLADLVSETGLRIDGVAEQDRSGFSVSGAGDTNGDGVGDIVVGAFGAPAGVGPNEGASYILFGTPRVLFADDFED
jgi:hypothetical protein